MTQQNIDFHGIPAPDTLIGVYASYFAGAKEIEQNGTKSIKVDFGMRSRNVYQMDGAMEEGFSKPDSPWVMLDSLSDGRNGSKAGIDMAGSGFLTMYHKDTKQLMIALPGMEYDYDKKVFFGLIPKDTVDDAAELFTGSQKQTKALHNYVLDVENKIEKGAFKGNDGQPLDIENPKPIIASHSMGCKPAHVMAALGYSVIAIEPRPITNGYLKSISQLCQKTLGIDITPKKAMSAIGKNCTTVRAQHCNVWNSTVLPWVKQRTVGKHFEYGNGQKATLADRDVGGHHAAEVLTPSLLRAFNSNSAAQQAPKGQSGMTLRQTTKPQHTFLQDILKRRK